MANMLYPIIDAVSNTVLNVIVLNQETANSWPLDDGQFLGVPGGAIGQFWNGSVYTDPTSNTDIAALKSKLIADAWSLQEKKLSDYTVHVSINGGSKPFGCDPVTIENITGINGLISQQLHGLLPPNTIPNPRPFTPKGEQIPVSVTHTEFAQIGAMLAYGKQLHFTVYATHKAYITALTDETEINNYDITTGWPT